MTPRSKWLVGLTVLVLAAVTLPALAILNLAWQREEAVARALAEHPARGEYDKLQTMLRWLEEDLERLRHGAAPGASERDRDRYEGALTRRRMLAWELERLRQTMPLEFDETSPVATRRSAPMNRLVAALVFEYGFVWWALLTLLSLRLPAWPGRRLITLGFALFAATGLVSWLASSQVLDRALGNTFGPWIYLVALAALIWGVASLRPGGLATRVGGSEMTYRYYTTDELISRAASTPTANEDLEQIKVRWFDALTRFVKDQPEQTALTGTDKYGRTILLERYTDMGLFEGRRCGQMRSVLVTLAGPGDGQPWMTATVEYSVDQAVRGRVVIPNEEVLQARQEPARLPEFQRIDRFLRTGKFRLRFREGVGAALLGLVKGGALIPVGLPLVVAGIAYAPLRGFIGRKGTRFVPTRCPETLPSERAGTPVGYWNALLPNLAECQAEVLKAVKAALGERAEAGIKIYQKDVVQWGGYTLKEVREQTVLEYRRAKVYLGVYRYGKDLYVRWDSHINRRTWSLHKFSHGQGVGYRFRKSWLAWAVPMFTQVPDVFEFAPADSATTDYDWADVDALQDLAHEILTDLVRRLKERYRIDKEIDFLMKGGERTDRSQQLAAAGEEKKSRGGWRQRFTRQQ